MRHGRMVGVLTTLGVLAEMVMPAPASAAAERSAVSSSASERGLRNASSSSVVSSARGVHLHVVLDDQYAHELIVRDSMRER